MTLRLRPGFRQAVAVVAPVTTTTTTEFQFVQLSCPYKAMFVNRENPRVLTSFFSSHKVLDLVRAGRAGAQRVGVCGLAFKGMAGTVNWQTIVFALARSKFAWKIPDESTEIDTLTEAHTAAAEFTLTHSRKQECVY